MLVVLVASTHVVAAFVAPAISVSLRSWLNQVTLGCTVWIKVPSMFERNSFSELEMSSSSSSGDEVLDLSIPVEKFKSLKSCI